MGERIKDDVLAKLSERLTEEAEKFLAPSTSNYKINCWTCGKYDQQAEHCYDCQNCNLWTLKKIFLHNRRYLRYLDIDQLHRMGFSP
jgi:hypothetical protein